MRENGEVLFQRIRDLLKHARGERYAVTLDRITKICDLPNRRTAEALLEEFLPTMGFVVVAGSKGYFRPTCAEQVNHYNNSLQSRLAKIAKRKAAVRKLAAHEGFIRDGKKFQDPPARQGELF